MNYQANEIHWRKGDVVIHDADAKEPRMLMRVVGYTRDGLCKTQYISTEHRRKIWTNPITVLHDPKRFGFSARTEQADFELVRSWNRKYQPGQLVDLKRDDGSVFRTKTRSAASHLSGYGAFVWLEGVGGAYWLRAVTPVETV